jgi:hypothetical protein
MLVHPELIGQCTGVWTSLNEWIHFICNFWRLVVVPSFLNDWIVALMPAIDSARQRRPGVKAGRDELSEGSGEENVIQY